VSQNQEKFVTYGSGKGGHPGKEDKVKINLELPRKGKQRGWKKPGVVLDPGGRGYSADTAPSRGTRQSKDKEGENREAQSSSRHFNREQASTRDLQKRAGEKKKKEGKPASHA